MSAVSIRNLGLNYGEFRALDDVSLDIEPGTVFGLLGPNGAGCLS
jgi:ABC-type multidrug transport system ATPase subunit